MLAMSKPCQPPANRHLDLSPLCPLFITNGSGVFAAAANRLLSEQLAVLHHTSDGYLADLNSVDAKINKLRSGVSVASNFPDRSLS